MEKKKKKVKRKKNVYMLKTPSHNCSTANLTNKKKIVISRRGKVERVFN